MPDLIGKTLGPYRIIHQIGLGGMATVYEAYQPAMDRYVALKVLSTHLTQDPAFIRRFEQEARMIAKLEHAHILPVHDHGEQDGYLYLVMRFVEAGTLTDRLKKGPLSLEEARRVVSQVGSALEYAHRLGVIHRDVKPSNVLIDAQGDCYLTDFGIAKMVEGTLGLTGSAIIGTPHYMAPEQSQSHKVDHRADIYAMGVMLYEMVTGRVPYDAETPFAVVMKHLTEPLPLPHNIKPDLPEAVERVILRALAKDPVDRYQSMRELVTAFEQAVLEAVPMAKPSLVKEPVLPPTTLMRASAIGQRRWLAARPTWLWIVAGLVVVVLIAAAIVLSRKRWQVQLPTPAPTTETAQAVVPLPTLTSAPEPMVRPSPDPVADQARAFAEPIRQAIANKPPDYQDDFSNPKSGWWQIESADKGKSGYADGEFLMSSSPPPSPGWQCNSATGPMPKPADFALEIDGRYVSGRPSGWQVQFRSWDMPSQGRSGGYVLSWSEQTFSIMACGDKDCRNLTEYSGSAVKHSADWNHIQIIARGTKITAYVNGEPAMYMEDSRYPVELGTGRFSLALCNMSDAPLEARWDNLRIWDVSQVLEPVSPLTPNPMLAQARNFGGPILKTIANRSPAFQDDFGNPASGWPQVGAMDRGKFGYVDGEYSVVANAAYPAPVVCNAVQVPTREFSDLVLEVDGRFAMGKDSNLTLAFRQWTITGKGRGAYNLGFNRLRETVVVSRGDSKANYNLTDYFGNATRTGAEWNHWQIIAKGSQLAVYVNGEPIMYLDDAGFTKDYGSGRLELGVCNEGDVPSDARWDNLRIWDISH